MTETLGVAIVGCGIISYNHAEAIARVPGLGVVALVDVDAASARLLADHIDGHGRPRPAAFAALADALAAGGVDIVVICTPSGLHVSLADEAIAAGKHVVIEKPLDVSLPRARQIAALADTAASRDLVVTVISQHRFDPASIVTHDAVANGGFGRLTSGIASIAWWREQEYYDSAAWRGTWELDGGGAAMNQGVHTIDLLLWMFGEPIDVSARTAALAHERIEVEDTLVSTITFASGALGLIHATTAAYPNVGTRLQVHGSLGSAIIEEDQLLYFSSAASDQEGNQAAAVVPTEEVRGNPRPDDSFVTGHLRQYRDIVAAIRDRRPAGVEVKDALLALAVVRALYLSATLGRTVGIAEVLDGSLDEVRGRSMKLSVFTASTPDWTPAEAARVLAAQGWDGVEWRVTDQESAAVPGFWAGNLATWPLTGLESSLAELAAITRDAGLEFSGIGGYARCDDHENVERMLAATAVLGAERVRVTMPRTDSVDYRALFASARADLEWVASRAEAHGVQALVELHHETITPSASAAFRLVDGLDPARVGVLHDLGNLVIEGFERHRSAFELLGPYLAHVHVKNARWVGGTDVAAPSTGSGTGNRGTGWGWRSEWATLRDGQADVFAYVRDLVEFGYDGWITLEDFSTERPLAERTADNLAYLRNALEAAGA